MTQLKLLQGAKFVISGGILVASLDAMYGMARDTAVSHGKWLLLVAVILIVWSAWTHGINAAIREERAAERAEARAKRKASRAR